MLAHSTPVTTLPAVDISRARKFYEEKLGFKPLMADSAGRDILYEAGDCGRVYVYQREPTKADHTVLSFEVGDIEQEVRELRSKGIVFEEYNQPGLKTVGGIATMGPKAKAAWFKDTEGNILSVVQM